MTSKNPAALALFHKGLVLVDHNRQTEAVDQFRLAIAQDPAFALAHAFLGYLTPGAGGSAELSKAQALAGDLPEAEREFIDLYAAIRPVKSVDGVKTRFENVDIVIVRENTESLYTGLEHIVVPGVVESLKIITERASTRIAKFAFEFAHRYGRKKITSVHKANIMKLSDGLFLDCCRRVAREFPEITYEEVIIDNMCMQLVRFPERYDVLLTENFYGDILSDLCAGLVGGLGVVPGANYGERNSVFEAVHGTAPDIAGKGLANPTALLMSSVMMLRHIDLPAEATRLEQAIWNVYTEGNVRTQDLGGKATCREFTDAIISKL